MTNSLLSDEEVMVDDDEDGDGEEYGLYSFGQQTVGKYLGSGEEGLGFEE
jgi:hypothetical protein